MLKQSKDNIWSQAMWWNVLLLYYIHPKLFCYQWVDWQDSRCSSEGRSKCIKWSNRQKLTDITYFSFYFHRPSLFQQPFWITCVIQGISAVISVVVVNLSLNEHITQYQTFFINTSRNAVCFPKVLKNLLQNIFLQV